MDKAGFRELLREGVRICEQVWVSSQKGGEISGSETRVGTTLDRIAQVGVLALEHENEWLWNETVDALVAIYRLAVPEDWRAWTQQVPPAKWLLAVIYRVDLLGAAATFKKRFTYLPVLVLQLVTDEHPDYWRRYAVTIAARSNLPGAFEGKSLIGPIAEYVRQRPQFESGFKSKPEIVVNSLCQFDFLACVAVVANSQDIGRAYPNFAAYYSHRILAVVHDLIAGGPTRASVPAVNDFELAVILKELDETARSAFFEINGWDGFDPTVYSYIEANAPG